VRIERKIDQHRRDFTALYVCEHCGAEKTDRGYDDRYFHETVIPSMACDACGKTAAGPSSTPTVPEGVVL